MTATACLKQGKNRVTKYSTQWEIDRTAKNSVGVTRSVTRL